MSPLSRTECHSVIEELEDAVACGNARDRLKMFQRVSDLFMSGSRRYSDEQLALFDDVLLRLSAEIETKVRAKLAQALAKTDKPLPKLIRSLAFDDAIEVAGPVLSHSPQLSDDDLVKNASTKSQDHLLAIAQRISLSEMVTDVLVDRGDRRVLRAVAGNAGARFSLEGFALLTARAPDDHKLALAILQRSDVPRHIFVKLVENASASVRAKLEAALPGAPAAIGAVVDGVAATMRQEAREASRAHAEAVADARLRFRQQAISEMNVHAPAVAQRLERTVLALSQLGGFPVDLVERALLDDGEEMVLVLARAAGCSWTTAKALLQMYSAKRTLSAADLERAFARFERLNPKTARLVVAFHERRAKLYGGAAPPTSTAGTSAAEAPRPAPAGRRRRAVEPNRVLTKPAEQVR
jgi:uncharacterized protein (DUF2336 family)